MRIDLKFTGIESVIHHLDKLSGPKAAEAYVKALNDTGCAGARARARIRIQNYP